MKKLWISLIIIAISFSGLEAKKVFIEHSELEIYSNLYNNGGTTYARLEGYKVMDFLPLELNMLKNIKNQLFSYSLGFTNGGTALGYYKSEGSIIPENKTMDFWHYSTSALYVYKQKYNFLPFLAFTTPFKTVYDKGLSEELVMQQQRLSLGAFSPVKNNTAILAVDYNRSSYEHFVSGSSSFRGSKGGISFRGQLNFNLDQKQSYFIAASTPTYWQHDLEEELPVEHLYFAGWIYNGGLNYQYSRNLEIGYRLTYREFNEYIDADGDKVNYPWVIEHGLKLKYKVRSFYKLYLTYDLIPSSYLLPDTLKDYKHELGAGLFFKHDKFSWNLGVQDCNLFSIDALQSLTVKADLNYEL